MATTPGSQYWGSLVSFPATNPRGWGGGTPNFDHVLLSAANASFIPGVPNGALYEFSNGELRLASVDPEGNPIQGAPAKGSDQEMIRITPDGRKVFFSSGAVYVRVDGTTTQVVSESHKTGEVGAVKPATYVGASRDGSVAYIFSADLTDDSAPGAEYLYRYTVSSGNLEMLTPVGVGPSAFQVSADGSTVYFESVSALTGAPSKGKNYYVWRDGELSLVAALDPSFDAPNLQRWASRNGRYLAFKSGTKLTDYAPTAPGCEETTANLDGKGGTCRQVYLYDADSHVLSCASCLPSDRTATGSAHFGYSESEWGDETVPRVVTDSGQVFFDSPDKLVSSDTNAVRDVYEYDGSTVRLISTGYGEAAQIAAVGGDGEDVFFTTQNKLVKEDTDRANDLYDARVGGGIASQNAAKPSAACAAEDCRGLAPAPPAPPPGGSETTIGPGSHTARKTRRCGKGRHKQSVKGKPRCLKRHQAHKNRRQGR
jgi:hypothetical protein